METVRLRTAEIPLIQPTSVLTTIHQLTISNRKTSMNQRPPQERTWIHSFGVRILVLRFIKKLRIKSNNLDIYSSKPQVLQLIGDLSMDDQAYVGNKTTLEQLMGTNTVQKPSLVTRVKRFAQSKYIWLKSVYLHLPIIDPDTALIKHFTVLLIMATIIELTLVPFLVCFDSVIDGHLHASTQLFINFPLFAIFCCDLIIKFNTGFYKAGRIIKKRQKITKKCFQLLKYDLLTAFSLFLYATTNRNQVSRFLYLTFLIRIKNLSEMVEILQSSYQIQSIYQYLWSLAKLSYLMIYGSHVISCFWYLLGVQHPEHSWITTYLAHGASLKQQYVVSLYWAITTMLTVGYGDILPVNDDEMIFSIFTMLVGCCLFGYVMSSIGSIFDQINNAQAELKNETKRINDFIKSNPINEALTVRIRQYLIHNFQQSEHSSQLNNSRYIPLLSKQLKTELIQQIFQQFFTENSLLNRFPGKLWTDYYGMIRERTFLPEECINDTNEFSWIFIIHGRICWKLQKTSHSLATYGTGQQINEHNFFSGIQRRNGYNITQSFTSILYIDRDEFIEFLRNRYYANFLQISQIKDMINLYSQFNQILQSCQICYQYDHTILQCPQAHFKPSIQRMLRLGKLKNQRRYVSRPFRIEWKTRERVVQLCESVERFQESTSDLDFNALSQESEGETGQIQTLDQQFSSSNFVESSTSPLKPDKQKRPIEARSQLDVIDYGSKRGIRRLRRGSTEQDRSFTMYEKSLQQLSKLPDFDQICDFENYFPQGNFSTVLTLSIQRVDRRPSSSKKPKRRPSRATLASRLDHCTQQFPEVKIEIKK